MNDPYSSNRSKIAGRDLKFAGTIAAGLCAGVLGVGAIAVPLVGWNDWPQALTSSNGDPITFVPGSSSAPRSGSSDGTRYTPRRTVTGPSGAIDLVTASGGLTGAADAPDAGGPTDGSSGTGTGSGSGSVRRSRSGLESVGGGSRASGRFVSGEFARSADSDRDGLADDYERAQGLDVGSNDAAADLDGDGLTNAMEFRLRSAANARDTNSDGIDDGADDADGDGVPNAVEIALGSNPYAADSDNDGIRDGDGDTDGDGITDAAEILTGTDPGVSDTPVATEPEDAPDTPAEPETDTVPAETEPTAVETPTPADPATPAEAPAAPAESPAPAAPAAPADVPAAPVQPADDKDHGKDDKGPDHHAPVQAPTDDQATEPDPVDVEDAPSDQVPTDPPDAGPQAKAAPGPAPAPAPAIAPAAAPTPPPPPAPPAQAAPAAAPAAAVAPAPAPAPAAPAAPAAAPAPEAAPAPAAEQPQP